MIANLIDELDIDEVDTEKNQVDDLRNKKIGINDCFTVMCDVNKLFLNYMIEKDVKLLTGSLSVVLKVVSFNIENATSHHF